MANISKTQKLNLEELFRIRGENLRLTAPLKSYIYSKFKPMLKHYPNIYDIHVDLSVDKGYKKVQDRKILYTAKGHIKAAPHTELVAKETSEEMYASIDLMCKSFDKQILKLKSKLKNHKNKLLSKVQHHGWKIPNKLKLKTEREEG